MQKYHRANAIAMINGGVVVANNNLKIEIAMESASLLMSDIEDNYKDMHTYKLIICPRSNVASPI